jgi:hypothetical protein
MRIFWSIILMMVISLFITTFISCKNPMDSEAEGTLQAPQNLSIVSMSSTQVTLAWNDANPNAKTGFIVEISTNDSSFSVVKTIEDNRTTTTITGTYDSTTIYSFRVQAKTSKNKSGYSDVVSRKMFSPVSIDMVLVQGGTFLMGDNTIPHNLNLCTVTLSSFYMDKYEVTYELWTEVYKWAITHGYTDLTAGGNGYKPNGSNNPVTDVNWYDVIKWCDARSEKKGLTPVYYTDSTHALVYRTGQRDLSIDAVNWRANGYHLPTEAESEFAARGGKFFTWIYLQRQRYT